MYRLLLRIERGNRLHLTSNINVSVRPVPHGSTWGTQRLLLANLLRSLMPHKVPVLGKIQGWNRSAAVILHTLILRGMPSRVPGILHDNTFTLCDGSLATVCCYRRRGALGVWLARVFVLIS